MITIRIPHPYELYSNLRNRLHSEWETFLATPTKKQEKRLVQELNEAELFCEQREWKQSVDTLRAAYETCGRGWYPRLLTKTVHQTWRIAEKCEKGMREEIEASLGGKNFNDALRVLKIFEQNRNIPWIHFTEDLKDLQNELLKI